jgi:hypothetical protein
LVSDSKILKQYTDLDFLLFTSIGQHVSQALGFFFKGIFFELGNKKEEFEKVEKVFCRGFL